MLTDVPVAESDVPNGVGKPYFPGWHMLVEMCLVPCQLGKWLLQSHYCRTGEEVSFVPLHPRLNFHN